LVANESKTITLDAAIEEGVRVLGKAHVDREEADIRGQLAADPVLGKETGKSLDGIVRRQLAERVHEQAKQAKLTEASEDSRFVREWNDRADWEPDFRRQALHFYGALTSKDSKIAVRLRALGLSAKRVRWLLSETDKFASELTMVSEDQSNGLMDWQYLFEYARCLKGGLRTLEVPIPDNEVSLLKPFVSVFVLAVLNYDRAFDPDSFNDYDDCFLQFVEKWDKVEYALGEDPFDKAVELARLYPVILPGERTGEDSVVFVASVAFHLQRLRGSESIMLPTERIGRLFGRSGEAARKSGSRVLKMVRQAGLLIETKADWNHRRAEAKEYRFAMEADSFVAPDGFVTQ